MDDWLQVPAARRPGEVLGAGQPSGVDNAAEPTPVTYDLLSPEHRDKLVAMFRWAAQGRRWDEVKDEVLAMFDITDPRAGGE